MSVDPTDTDTLKAAYRTSSSTFLHDLEGIDEQVVSKQIEPLVVYAPDVLVLKCGEPSSQEATQTVKDALMAALDRLGYGDLGIAFVRVGEEAAHEKAAWAQLLQTVIEVADPETVILIDEDARRVFNEGMGGEKDLSQGVVRQVRGRKVLYVGDFETMLADESEKRRSWRFLQGVKRRDPIY